MLPTPRDLSDEARAFLELHRDPEEPLPPLDDTDGWLALDAAGSAVAAARLRGRRVDVPVQRFDVDGVTVYEALPEGADEDCLYLEIHGGGLVHGGGELVELTIGNSALTTGLLTWSIDYRLPPLFPYPAALDDCVCVYRAALERWSAERIVVGGGSAGGNLAAALMLRARDEGLPLPAGLVLLTPEVDLTESGDTYTVLGGGIDVILPRSLMPENLLYAGGADLAHPYLSPLFGGLDGFPPTILQSGTRDLFLSNTVRMHRRLREAGVDAELHVFEAMPHGGFGGDAPEDRELLREVRRFVRRRLGLGDSSLH